jgi:hypothetical protein
MKGRRMELGIIAPLTRHLCTSYKTRSPGRSFLWEKALGVHGMNSRTNSNLLEKKQVSLAELLTRAL